MSVNATDLHQTMASCHPNNWVITNPDIQETILRALSLLAAVEDGDEIVRELRDAERACLDVGLKESAWVYGKAAARIVSDAQEKAALKAELASVKAELQNIAEADYRKWDPEMRDPQSFVDWAKSRARHALAAHPKEGA